MEERACDLCPSESGVLSSALSSPTHSPENAVAAFSFSAEGMLGSSDLDTEEHFLLMDLEGSDLQG